MNNFPSIIKHNGEMAISARELYDFLGVRSIFTNWCKRMFEYGFEAEKDFFPFLEESSGGRPATDFILTIDTAKEISMLQRTERGKEVRRYFIECEKKMIKVKSNASPLSLARHMLEAMELQEQRLAQVETTVKRVEAKVMTVNDEYYSLSGWYRLHERRWDLNRVQSQQMGKKLARESRLSGFGVHATHDAKYGSVNTYHRDVLASVLGFGGHVQ